MTRRILTIALVGIFSCSAQATVLTYTGGNGTFGDGFEQTSVDYFDDGVIAVEPETDVHDDQAYGDNVTGSGPDANNFSYNNYGEGFTPNITVQHRPDGRRHDSFGGCYGGSGANSMCSSTGPVPSPDGIETPFFHFQSSGPADLTNWVEFTAEPGHTVTMLDLVVAGDIGTGIDPAVIVTLKNSVGSEMFSSGPLPILANEASVVDLEATTAEFVRLEIDWNPGIFAGSPYSIGDFTVDNIRFCQEGDFCRPPTEFTWNKNGLGEWGIDENWVLALGHPDGADHTAIFADTATITGPTNVATTDPITLNRIEFSNPTNSVAISGFGSLNLSANSDVSPVDPTISVQGAHEIQVPVNLLRDTTVDVAVDSTLIFNNALDLMGNTLTKTGFGEIAIRNNLLTSGGTLHCSEGICSGSGSISGDVTNDGGTISPGDSAGGVESVVPEPCSRLLMALGVLGAAGFVTRTPAGRLSNQFLALAIVAMVHGPLPATIITYRGGLGPGTGESFAFEDGPNFPYVDGFDDSLFGEIDVHDDQAMGDKVTGPGPDVNGFEYGNNGEGFTPNVSVTHGGTVWRHTSLGGTYGGVSDDGVAPHGYTLPGALISRGQDAIHGCVATIDFAAEPGFFVTLEDVVLVGDAFTNCDPTSSDCPIVRVKNSAGATIFVQQADIDVDTDTLVTVGLSDRSLTLEIDFNLSTLLPQDYSWDNIRFSQGVGDPPPLPDPFTEFTWIANGLGDWGATVNWMPFAGGPNGSGDTAILTDVPGVVTGRTNVSTNLPVTVNRIELSNVDYIISGLGSVNLATGADSTFPRIDSRRGTHEFQVRLTLHGDTTVDVDSDSKLIFSHQLDLNGNKLIKIGPGEIAINNTLLSGDGGTFDCFDGICSGAGTIAGSVNNSGGTISPGNSPGVMTIEGDFSQGESGTLLIEVGGNAAGSEYDVLRVDGAVSLAGTLQVSLLGGFQPTLGDSFGILEVGSLQGGFDDVLLPALAGTLAWNVSALGVDGSISVVPEATSLMLLLLGGFGWILFAGGSRALEKPWRASEITD